MLWIYSVMMNLLINVESEPNLLQFPEPLVMVGDIHGQYYDLVHLLEKAGDPSCTK
jgi:serine/threonine-protein phosphatase 2B catalytic subunit